MSGVVYIYDGTHPTVAPEERLPVYTIESPNPSPGDFFGFPVRVGDGKVFIWPIEDVMRLRTRERGPGAV